MRYLHTMVRTTDLEKSLDFYCKALGLVEQRRKEFPQGKFTLVFLAAPEDEASAKATGAPELEITYNWDTDEKLETGRSWGHLAYRVENIYETCQRLMDHGVTINGQNYGPITATLERQVGANAWVAIALREGKNREIRRVMEHLGYSVSRLIRTSFGPFQLGKMARGSVEEVPARVLASNLPRDVKADAAHHRR